MATLLLAVFMIPVAAAGEGAIVARYPHDPDAFTQGLLYDDGGLWESTGRYGASTLRRVDLASGEVERSVAIADHYFGEGLALANNRLYQLTWKAGIAFVYAPESLERIGRLRYTGEGWGLTWDGRRLIMSDGSASLRFLDANDFTVTRRLPVTENGKPVDKINELEYIGGEIWANIWHKDRIVRIDPASGVVLGSIDAADLRAALPADNTAGVLNGIAWDADRDRIFVTGKNWPRLFEIAPAGKAAEQTAPGTRH